MFTAYRRAAMRRATLLCCALSPAPLLATTPNPIQHVIFIVQENRSFDHYFGTFPGANGLPANLCVPLNPTKPALGCVVPFHDPHGVNSGGPHGSIDSGNDIDGGAMDGFVLSQSTAVTNCGAASEDAASKGKRDCSLFYPGVARHDVMGYHTAAEIPNYWAYAQHFVLQDALFEPVPSYSLPAHLHMVSEWSASCKNGVLSTCKTSTSPGQPGASVTPYPWASMFQLMDSKGVSWKYYIANGTEPDCSDGSMTCPPAELTPTSNSYWNPAIGFGWVRAQGSAYLAAHIPTADVYLQDIAAGTLPQVSWIIPSDDYSEHPPYTLMAGMDYTTALVNAVMRSKYWYNTAIFIFWDDWGGFYDHVQPPTPAPGTADYGYGMRVPGIMISPYARKNSQGLPGYIDHSVLSFDSYNTFIEDLFMGGARLDPAALGQPDARPDIRDAQTTVTFPNGTVAPIGNLMNEFDFTQTPRGTLLLNTHVPDSLVITCKAANPDYPNICSANVVNLSWNSSATAQIPGPFTYQVYRDGVAVVKCTNISTTICKDTAVPSGAHFYTLTSTDSSGTVSPASAAAEADVP